MEIAKILKLLAVAFALVTGLVHIPHADILIAVLGITAGAFVLLEKVEMFLLCTLTLALVHGAFASLPYLGVYLTDMLGGLSALFNATACIVVLRVTAIRLNPQHNGTAQKPSGTAP